MNRRVIALCPGGSVTGGPELIHQLVDLLRKLGVNAFVCYFPFNVKFDKPEPYQKYDAPLSNFLDDKSTLFIFPESVTWMTRLVKAGEVAIWWMSVDNYRGTLGDSLIKDAYMRLKLFGRRRIPLIFMKHHLHFVQSEYAYRYLSNSRIKALFLTDYISVEHSIAEKSFEPKQNIIAYNPKKGRFRTAHLIKANPTIQFVPIVNMTPDEVSKLLRRAKVYIDFGHHPGKDRLPREAALAGCCVITNLRGSAQFREDLPIPTKYKINDRRANFPSEFRRLVESIFTDFQRHTLDFDEYRDLINNEKRLFECQVNRIFNANIEK